MFNPDKFQWRPFSVNENIPEYVIAWLLDNQSLTAKLRNKYDDFCVNVLSQQENNPYQCELKLLDINKKNTIIVREVELIGDSQAVVFARSVIPKTPDTEDILSIGSKPLGEILFNDKLIIKFSFRILVSIRSGLSLSRSNCILDCNSLYFSCIWNENAN